MASSRSQASRGDMAPRFITGIPCSAAMRSPIPVPPVTAESRVHATHRIDGPVELRREEDGRVPSVQLPGGG